MSEAEEMFEELSESSEAEGKQQEAAEFVAMLLHGVTAIHMLHLLRKGPKSYARHVALNEAYDGLSDMTDKLAEAYFGCDSGGLITSYPGIKFPSFDTETDPLAYVKELYGYVESERKAMGGESHIQNIVDEICSLLSTAIYKLRDLG